MSLVIIDAETYVNQQIGWSKLMEEGGADWWNDSWRESDRERWERARAGGIDYGHEWQEWVHEKAIDHAREIIAPTGGGSLILTAVVTWGGSAMAMVRWNLDVDADPPIEVARFKDQLTLC